tara:strand:+ start:880 stop:2523 length:1644 start_codon:yes stop_codon:yes gene_type:complete
MNPEETLTFLAALYPSDLPEGTALLTWTLPDKRSTWHSSTSTVTADDKQDTYIGAGLAPAPGYGAVRRAKSAQIIGIPGLWLDLDYQDGEAHRKPNLPTEAEATEFISELSSMRAPSLIVRSGHGFQLWWLFDQPWQWEPDDEYSRDRAAAMQTGLVYHVRDLARGHGWDVDATIDLARVMRLPGSMNLKATPVPVTMTDTGTERRSVESWEAIQSALESPRAPALVGMGGTPPLPTPSKHLPAAAFNPTAVPPFEKWEALQAADPRVLKTWNRRRSTTGPQGLADQSASAYDMALASFASRALWNEQEITDLLVAHRRKHGDDLKRADYYVRTIDRARLDGSNDQMGDDGETPPLAALSTLWGVTVQRVTKFLADPPTYTLTLSVDGVDRTITLGGVGSILEQRAFRSKVAASVDIVIPSCPSATWEQRAKMMLGALTIEELGPEAEPAGVAALWVDEYLAQQTPSEDDWQVYLLLGKPYRLPADPGWVYLTLRGLAFWLRTTRGERVTERELGRYLRMGGAERRVQNVAREDGAMTSRSVWRIEG